MCDPCTRTFATDFIRTTRSQKEPALDYFQLRAKTTGGERGVCRDHKRMRHGGVTSWWWACLMLAGTGLQQSEGRILSVEDFGAVAEDVLSNCTNTDAFNDAIASAAPGDTILVPGGKTFYFTGGMAGENLRNVSFVIEGNMVAVQDSALWPQNDDGAFVDFIALTSCKDLHIAGPGYIDGQGKWWWNQCLIGKIRCEFLPFLAFCPDRIRPLFVPSHDYVRLRSRFPNFPSAGALAH